jgi:phage host-nuclease inhibitor protein Gam
MSKLKAKAKVSLAVAQEAARNYQAERIALTKIEATISEEVSKIRSKYQEKINAANEALLTHFEVMQAFAEQDYSNWDKKSLDLTYCKIGYRAGSRKVALCENVSWDDALKALKESKALKKLFVVTTEAIDKKAVLAVKDDAMLGRLVEEVGLFVEKDDDGFYVEAKQAEVIQS